ncbi:DUF6415 family natural product biosynthesis protein [Streptomyces vinaceus]|uniref:DUF6415 family natural product biosynthesis protein n=1 Tax=Streptomyces vinaceus TaxID=1960 RepID=UPI0036C71F68
MAGTAGTIDELTERALGAYDQRPDAQGVAHLVDDLITAGQKLHSEVSHIPDDRRSRRAGAALIEWTYFIETGPLRSGDHANWNYARGLARIVRTLAAAAGAR